MSTDLFMVVEYDIKADTFQIGGNIKPERHGEVLGDFIHGCVVGAGVDESPPEERETYTIRIQLDISDDTFRVSHNCGNKGLRDGILMRVLRDLK